MFVTFAPIVFFSFLFQFSPQDAEDYVAYLKEAERLDEVAVRLAKLVNSDDFVSKYGKSNHQLWNELCELISQNPLRVK